MTLEDLNQMLVGEGYLDIEPIFTAEDIIAEMEVQE